MMLKQTIETDDGNGHLILDGQTISLGDYESVVHGHDTDKKMQFSISYTSNHDAQEFRHRHSYYLPFGNDDIRTVLLKYDYVANTPLLASFSFDCLGKVNYAVSRGRESSSGYFYSLTGEHNLRSAVARNAKIDPKNGLAYTELDHSLALSSFKIDDKTNLPKNQAVLENETMLSNYTEQVLDDISYILRDAKYLGPLRSSPKRFYSSEIISYQRGQGKGNLGFDLFNSSQGTKNKINKYLEEFSIPYTIDAKNIGDSKTGRIISIELHDKRSNATVTPKDVGFGIGQVLPIILESTVSKNQLICVEQPEIHLHPRLQAHLADLFIDSSINSNNQWVIETHSESLMLRLQRRIREKVIPKDMVSVLYVDVGECGAKVIEIPIDEEGDFLAHWPHGFFEERIEELFGAEQ